LWLASGCSNHAPLPAQPQADAHRAEERLTVLFTSDEHGWLEPFSVDGVEHGGVVQLLRQLEGAEGHCPGPLPHRPAPPCANDRTLLLSGGDNYTGPAISTYFRGATMAISMRRLGYAAAALGNHDLDFGRQAFDANRTSASIPYLAANILRDDHRQPSLVKPYVLLHRGRVTIGVVGLATVDTPKTAAAQRFVGLRFDDPAATLDRVVPEVRRQGADAVVVLFHECHDRVAPLVRSHPQWHLSFVGTGHCHRTAMELVAGVPIIGPSWRLSHYGRVELSIDTTAPPLERSHVVDYGLVEVAQDGRAGRAEPDAALARRIAGWSKEVHRALGEVVGYSAVGLARQSDAIGQWITGAWRQHFDADLAITTRGAIRQGLPPGPITLETIWSIMPFDNDLVVCQIDGAALASMLVDPDAIVAGLHRDEHGALLDDDEQPLDPKRRYRVVTTDFLFHGGDGYTFYRLDRAPRLTGTSWRKPVVSWTRAAESSRQRPLERVLAGKRAPKATSAE